MRARERLHANGVAFASDVVVVVCVRTHPLQRQLMEQKTSYHNLTKKTEAARLALQRTNVALIATETAVDEKTAEVR